MNPAHSYGRETNRRMSGVKLSTKSTYGLRAMVNIAMAKEREAISIKEISEAEGISGVYLEQLLNKLRR